MATKKKTNRNQAGPGPAQLLSRYRERLAALLAEAEAAAPGEPALLRAAVTALVEALNVDLLHLYRSVETGELTRNEAAIVLPALERLRDVLRHRSVRVRSIRDTLHKAVTGLVFASGRGLDSGVIRSSS